jgi:hypothetical protein
MTKLECVDKHQACDSIALNGMCTSRHIPNVMQICTKSCNPECGGGVNVGCPIQCKQMIGCKNFVLEPKNSKGSGIGLQCGNWDEAMEKKGAMIAYNCENPACSEIATTSTPSAVEVGSSCADKNPSCAVWASYGYCKGDTNVWMSENCARSCNPSCSSNATTTSLVTTTAPSVQQPWAVAAVASNLQLAQVGSSCVDNNTSCAQMVHLCNIDFVSKNCARSCNPSCSSNATTTSLVTTTAPLVQSAQIASMAEKKHLLQA